MGSFSSSRYSKARERTSRVRTRGPTPATSLIRSRRPSARASPRKYRTSRRPSTRAPRLGEYDLRKPPLVVVKRSERDGVELRALDEGGLAASGVLGQEDLVPFLETGGGVDGDVLAREEVASKSARPDIGIRAQGQGVAFHRRSRPTWNDGGGSFTEPLSREGELVGNVVERERYRRAADRELALSLIDSGDVAHGLGHERHHHQGDGEREEHFEKAEAPGSARGEPRTYRHESIVADRAAGSQPSKSQLRA